MSELSTRQADFSATAFYDGYWQTRLRRGDATAPNRVKLRHEQAVAALLAYAQAEGKKPGDLRVLDLGCGDGVMGQMLRPLGFVAFGLDVSRRVLAQAAPHYDRTVAADLNDPATEAAPLFNGRTFDAVVCLEVLEHVEDPQRTLRLAHDLLHPGGLAVFSYPNFFSWKNRWAILRGRWPQSYTTYDPREHLHVFELPTLCRWLGDAGFAVRDVAITPDLPGFRPLRRAMFKVRRLLARVGPSLWAMQVNVVCTKA